MGTIIGMYGAGTGGSQSNVASIDTPKDGFLTGIQWALRGDLDSNDETVDVEISFGSSIMSTINDTRARIFLATLGQMNVGAAGATIAVANGYSSLPDLPVGMGERIFMHGLSTAGTTWVAVAHLHFSFDLDQALVRRR